jgi:hypothetical protein
MSFATSLGLLLLGFFVLPVLVGGCLPNGRNGVSWYEARRDPTGLAPDPAGTPEAVVQVYAAGAVSWRGDSRSAHLDRDQADRSRPLYEV